MKKLGTLYFEIAKNNGAKYLQFCHGWGQGERDCNGTIYPKMLQCASSSQSHGKLTNKLGDFFESF